MAIANNSTLQTNLNVDPYYDDFDESKNFYRILFRPGLAVKARELTQMQTILQNQVDRVGEHLFKEGSIVRGIDINYDYQTKYIKVKDNHGKAVSQYVGQTLVGQTNSVEAIVLASNTGAQAETPNLATFYIKYTKSGASGTVSEFVADEKLQLSGDATANAVVASTSETPLGFAARLSISEGIIYARDHFIRVPEQSVIVSKYAANTVTAKVGFIINETIVNSQTETTLLDPAQGAYNYTAPGADRLKLTATLDVRPVSNNDTNFIEILRVKDGTVISKTERTLYNKIRDYMAQRTMDESGNYRVRGYGLKLREHLNNGTNGGLYLSSNPGTVDQPTGNNQLQVVEVSAGKAYVQGYDVGQISTARKNIRKGIDVGQLEDMNIPAQYGNYVICNEVVGEWPLTDHTVVSLRDTVSDSITAKEWSVTGAVGSEIGTARVKSIQYYTGAPGSAQATYKIYLYDIQMTGAPFTSVRSLYLNNAITADAKADLVLVGGNAVLYETDFNRSIYNIPASNIKTLRYSSNLYDTLFKFHQKYNQTFATDGTTTVSISETGVSFPFSTGTLSDSQVGENFHVIFNAEANTAALTGTVGVSSGANSVSGSGTAFTTQLNVGEIINLGSAGDLVVSNITSDTALTVLGTSPATVSSQAFFKKFKIGQHINMQGVGVGGNREIEITSATAATIRMRETLNSTVSATVLTELNKTDGSEISKVRKASRYVRINTATHASGVSGPWDLGFSDIWKINSVRKHSSIITSSTQGSDVTSDFVLDNGQTDNLYKHGVLKVKPGSSLTITSGDYLLINLDYFTHDTSTGVGYLSVDSYPIDDVNGSTANTNSISTQEIPYFTSPIDNKVFKLRDSIDFRPRVTDTATDTTVVGSSTTNPASSVVLTQPSGGLHFSPPNESFFADSQYYLKRNDRIVVNKTGNIVVVEGQPSTFPITPETPGDAMTLGVINVAPYPSLTPQASREYDRPEMTSAIKLEKNERYTMKDIGAIKNRVDNLEYYTSLNLLEKATKDLSIQDSSGIDRFKNGMLVDPFNGHNIGNVYNTDYSVSIDKQNKELRPKFKLDSVELEYNSGSSNVVRAPADAKITTATLGSYSNGESITVGATTAVLKYQNGQDLFLEQVNGSPLTGATVTGLTSGAVTTASVVKVPTPGDLVTLPYTHEEMITQDLASSTRSCAGLLWNWAGQVQLSPDSDYWTDTTTRPDVNINFDLNTDNWVAMANSWETEWNDWQTLVTGVSQVGSRQVVTGVSSGGPGSAIVQSLGRETTLETTQLQSRQGVRNEVVPETRVDSLGSRIVDVSVQPYMRPRIIQFVGNGLKPNTKLYSFFDGINVESYVTPANSSFSNTGVEGSSLVSTTDGKVHGHFRIPADDTLRFTTGSKIFRLTDSEVNSKLQGKQVTSAETSYTASGINAIEEETILSTRFPRFTTNQVQEARSVVSRSTSVSPNGSRVIGFVPNPEPAGAGADTGDDGDSSCFVKGTTIRLADGSDKKIEDVQIGDVILGQDGAHNIVLEFDHPMLAGRDLVGINEAGPLMTPEHPLWTDSGWKAFNVDHTLKAYPHLESLMQGNLDVGDKILDVDGNWIEVESLEIYPNQPDQQVYNFILDGNNTYHANGYLAHNRDPVAQSFTVDARLTGGERFNVPGVFLSKIDLYFSSKHVSLGALIEIREMNEDLTNPTNSVMPFGAVNLTADEIYTSSDSSVATPIAFPSPVYLKNGVDYCIVITPHGYNPDLRVWVARIGEKDILTQKSIIKNPASGILFASSNDKTYKQVQEEDFKFKAYYASFGTNNAATTGSLILKNTNQEFLTIANQTGGLFNSIGSMVYGATTLNLASSPTVNSNSSEYANGSVSGAQGTVEYVSGSTIRVAQRGPNAPAFQASESVSFYYVANNTATGASATISSIAQPKGKIYQYDNVNAANTYLYLANTSGQFYINTTITNQTSNATARIVSIDNLRSDVHMLNLGGFNPTGTTLTSSTKMALTPSSLDTAYRPTTPNENISLNGSRYILSTSNELANISGNKSVEYKVDLSKPNQVSRRLSPVVDLSRIAVTSVKNLVNNDTTNENSTSGGNALSKYISRTVTLAEGQDAEDLNVYLSAYNNGSSTIKVYHKLVNAEDADGIASTQWFEMTQETVSTIVSDSINTDDFKEYKFVINSASMTGGSGEYQYIKNGVTFTGFKHFAVKIVLLSTDPSNPPRVKDFRAIALQI